MRKSVLLGVTLLAAVAISRAEAATVTVTSPNGGEYWCIGTYQKITWTLSPANPSLTNVKIQVSRDGGPYQDIATGEKNDGAFIWKVDGPATTQAKIKVVIGSNSDVSNSYFTIAQSLMNYAEKEFEILGDGTYYVSLVLCPVSSQDPSGAQSFDYKYIYTIRSKDTDVKVFPNSYLGGFSVSNCRDPFFGLKPRQPGEAEEAGWTVNDGSLGKDEVKWETGDSKANGVGPTKQLMVFIVYTDRKPVLSNFYANSLHYKNAYDYGKVFSGTFEYWTPGCPDDDGGGDQGCVHKFNLAQVYPADSYGTLSGFPDMSCWSGYNSEPIPADKLAIPGVLCLATKNNLLDVEAFISGNYGNGYDTCCAYPYIQSVDLLKVSPPSYKMPIFGGYTVHQYGVKNIRTWWPLAYTMPGTTFTLTLRGVCKNGDYYPKPYKEVYKWKVVANADTFNHLIDLFHTNALGELEVPSIVGEDIYAALKECAANLKDAIHALNEDPENSYLRKEVCDEIIECEALILTNTLFLDHLDAPEEMTYPYYQAAPKRILPGNLAIYDPNVQQGEYGGGMIGILDTDQNPAASKLMVDLEWISRKYCGEGDDYDDDYDDDYGDDGGYDDGGYDDGGYDDGGYDDGYGY
jgi:hypothetical protein